MKNKAWTRIKELPDRIVLKNQPEGTKFETEEKELFSHLGQNPNFQGSQKKKSIISREKYSNNES